MKLLIVTAFFFTQLLFSYEGMIYLHINNINSFYKNFTQNKTVKDLKKSKSFEIFKKSKLYLRLKKDISALDPENKILNFENLSKLPQTSLDLYLLNISQEKFIADIKLEKSQSYSLINLKTDTLKKLEYKQNTVIVYKNLYIVIKNDRLYISNELEPFKNFLNSPENFYNGKKLNKYENFMYLNMSKILNTPYLRTYWFTSSKNFKNIKEVFISFKLTENDFQEEGEIIPVNFIKNSQTFKSIAGNYKINLFYRDNNFKLPAFNSKDLTVFNLVTDNFKDIVYLAKYNSSKSIPEYVKEFFKGITVKTEKDIITVKYGLLNKEKIYFRKIENYMLISTQKELLQKIKLKDSSKTLKSIEIKDFSPIREKITKLIKNETENFSFNGFVNNFLLNYLNIKYFKHKSYFENEKIKFTTKIIF